MDWNFHLLSYGIHLKMNNKPPYKSLTSFFKERFGTRVQKISLHLNFTCPNKDGSKGRGGCYYCNNDGFVPSYCHPALPVKKQMEEGILFHKKRYRRAIKYLAYFQAYTNTYDSVEKLEKIYKEALEIDNVVGISISTRPDCVSKEHIDLFKQISKNYFVMLEIGVESLRNETLQLTNRGHTVKDSLETLKLLHENQLFTVIHYILGLPGETQETLLEDIKLLNQLPFDAIKLHHLQILKNTVFEKWYKKNPSIFNLFDLPEYINFISRYLCFLHPEKYIDRLASEVPPRVLIAPQWGLIRYDEIARKIEQYMLKNNLFQGKFYNTFFTTNCMV